MVKKVLSVFVLCSVLSFSVRGQESVVPQLGKAPVDEVIKAMTIDEKVNLLVGIGKGTIGIEALIGMTKDLVPGAAGATYAIPRLGIPSVVMADGPAGLRISPKREGSDQTYYATHFPVETLMGSTWNTDLVEQVGKAVGNEVLEYGVDVLLAPAVNIHRNPLNGRNYEYYSEDPVLSGKMGAAMIKGVQYNGVGTSLKHFAANNQETNRTRNNSIVSERALREIYLKPFEIVVKESSPWTVMTSYNLLNGTYTSERADLNTTILRDEWGFKGLVMTDWYGGINPVRQIRAGNDLIMPGTDVEREELLAAIKNGTLSLHDVDRDLRNVLNFILQSPNFRKYKASNTPDLKAHAAVTRNSAAEGMVLLKNNEGALPFSKSTKKIAVLGITSYDFIAGGTGSGNVNRAYTVSLTEGLANSGLKTDKVLEKRYASYIAEQTAKLPKREWWAPKLRIDEMQLSTADIEKLSQNQDAAVITIGRSSGEFMDRKLKDDFYLSDTEQKLISDVCEIFHKNKKKVIVILNIAGVIETDSWKNKPDAILVAWLAGQEGGNTVADIITGKVNPSGKLSMTFPVVYEDVPSATNFPIRDNIKDEVIASTISFNKTLKSENRKNIDYTVYEEGIFVGYRYYDKFGKQVSYPFGYGLSYTKFDYSDMKVSQTGDLYSVTFNVKNIGQVAGKEVAELYVSATSGSLNKPLQELKGFAKTKLLQPGEVQTVRIEVPLSYLASFDEANSNWIVEDGNYQFKIGASSRDIKLDESININSRIIEKVHPVLQPQQVIKELR